MSKKMYNRDCPKCNIKIIYKSKTNFYRARKIKSLCKNVQIICQNIGKR